MSEIDRKYGRWIAQAYKGNHPEWVSELVLFFHNNREKFKYKDIYQYKLYELKEEAALYKSNRAERVRIKEEGAEKIYDDGQVSITRIDRFQAMKLYGANTRWCTTQAHHFFHYTLTGGNVIYVVCINMCKSDLIVPEFGRQKFVVLGDLKSGTIRANAYNCVDDKNKFGLMFTDKLRDLTKLDLLKVTDKKIHRHQTKVLFEEFDAIRNEIDCYCKSDYESILTWLPKAQYKKYIKHYLEILCLESNNHIPSELAYIPVSQLIAFGLHTKKPYDSYIASRVGVRGIKQLDLTNENVRKILLDRSKHDNQIKIELMKLGFIKSRQTKFIVDLSKLNKKQKLALTETGILRR